MSPAEVLAQLSKDQTSHPLDALAAADEHRAALVEPLLAAVERCLEEPYLSTAEDLNLFSYAVYLFAKWREARAYPSVVRWLSLPEEEPFVIAGDVVTQDGARILAAVSNGDLAPIKALILNRGADEYGRSAGVSALALLAVWGEAQRDEIVDHFLWLAREGVEREPSNVWDSLAAECADIEALEVFPAIRQAYADGLTDPQCMGLSELDEVEAGPRGRWFQQMRARHRPIDDVATAARWWSFEKAAEPEDEEDDLDDSWDADDAEPGEDDLGPQEPYRAPPKVGRNAPCPCGSGKKYKKCCGV
jgi:Protein of unknown function (DUF1186)/SEC-C motif